MDATSEEQDMVTKIVRYAAKLNNAVIADIVKAATGVAVKLMAHTRLTE